MDSDDNLVMQAQRGDHKAFDALFAQYRARILAYCTRLLDNAAAGEEATQDAWVQAWRKLSSFRCDSPFVHWLLSIATNTCLNLLRAKKNRPHPSLDDPDIWSDGGEPGQPDSGVESDVVRQVYAEQLLRLIRQRAKTAKPSWDTLDWNIFHLRYERGLTMARQVARLLEKSEDTVKYRIYKRINPVLEAVRAELEKEETSL